MNFLRQTLNSLDSAMGDRLGEIDEEHLNNTEQLGSSGVATISLPRDEFHESELSMPSFASAPVSISPGFSNSPHSSVSVSRNPSLQSLHLPPQAQSHIPTPPLSSQNGIPTSSSNSSLPLTASSPSAAQIPYDKLVRENLKLTKNIENLKEEIQTAWSQYESVVEKSLASETELKNTIRALRSQEQNVKQQEQYELNEARQAVNRLQNEKDILENDNNKLVQRVNELELLLASNKKKYEQELLRIRTDLTTSREQIQYGSLKALKERLEYSENLTERLQNELETLRRSGEDTITRLENENMSLAKANTDLKSRLSLMHSMDDVSASAKSQTERESDSDALGSPSTSDAASHTSSVSSLAPLVPIDTSLLQLRKENNLLQTELITLTEKYDKVNNLFEVYENKYKNLQQEFTQTNLTHTNEVQRLNHYIKNLENQISNVRMNNQTEADELKKQQEQERKAQEAQEAAVQQSTPLRPEVNVAEFESLSRMLIKKQDEIMLLSNERSALKAKIMDLQERCTTAESSLRQYKEMEFSGDPNIYDDSPPVSYSSSSSSSGLQRRGQKSSSNNHTSSMLISDLERIGVKPGERVRNTISAFDSFALIIARMIRANSFIRLGFFVYMLFLHFWVFFILMMHSQGLEEEQTPTIYNPHIQNDLSRSID